MIAILLMPLSFMAAGVLCILRPDGIAVWIRSFSRPIHSDRPLSHAEEAGSRRQTEQVTARPIYIRLFGIVLSGAGLWILLKMLPFVLSFQHAG